MGFIQTGKCPVMTPLGRAMTGRPWIWWSKYDKLNHHKIVKDLDLKSLLRWSVKTSFSASTLSSLKPVVESMFPGKNKLFSKTSYWHSMCNLTCPNQHLTYFHQPGRFSLTLNQPLSTRWPTLIHLSGFNAIWLDTVYIWRTRWIAIMTRHHDHLYRWQVQVRTGTYRQLFHPEQVKIFFSRSSLAN